MQEPDPLSTLVNFVNDVRTRQELDGSITAPESANYARINALMCKLDRQTSSIDGLSPALLMATLEDLGNWVKSGLDQRPLFDQTLASFKTPAPGNALFLFAPMRAPNGPDPKGFRLELVTGYRSETPYLANAAQYTRYYLAPFQCIKLGAASKGFLQGNCIVLFPESVAAAD